MTTNAELKEEIEALKERVKALEPEAPTTRERLSPIDPETVGPLLGKMVRVVYTDPKSNPSNMEGVFEGCKWIDCDDVAALDIGGVWELCQNVHALEELDREPGRHDWGVDADTHWIYSEGIMQRTDDDSKRQKRDYAIDATYQDAWDAVMGKTVTVKTNAGAVRSALVNGIGIDDTGHAIALYHGNRHQLNAVDCKLVGIE